MTLMKPGSTAHESAAQDRSHPITKLRTDTQRRYHVPSGIVRGDGSDVLSVRVFDGHGSGGIYEAGAPAVRVGPFDPGSSPGGPSTGHVLGGTAWYRKHFKLGPESSGKDVSIRFDGVYMDAEFWLNGRRLGDHPYGYTSFEFNLTEAAQSSGQENILAVRVRNEGKNSRWYSGSGIYRHVWLTTTDPIHIPLWGLSVTTPNISKEKATVVVSVEIDNPAGETNVSVRARLLAPNGKVLKTAEAPARVAPNKSGQVELKFEVTAPQLWSPASPSLYRAVAEVVSDNTARRKSPRFLASAKLKWTQTAAFYSTASQSN